MARAYLQLPINPDEGFPQAFRLNFASQAYAILLYVNVPETNPEPPSNTVYNLPTTDAFMVMRVTREGGNASQIIFQRKLVLNLEYQAAELAFVFRQLLVAKRNLNGIGPFGSNVLGGIALWDS
jgi:hypothetical protein